MPAGIVRQSILTGNERLGIYPMEKLKRVEKPTTLITDSVQRVDERESGFSRAARGDFGPVAAAERRRGPKTPILAVTSNLIRALVPLADGKVAESKAPLPARPEVLSRHIKKLAYFFRADLVGICRLPRYAVYTHDFNGNPVDLNHQFAIVILVDQDYGTLEASTGNDWISNPQAFRAYSSVAGISSMVADYIRKLGYPARAHHMFTYQVTVPPLLLLSGIGEMCRIGIVLNPFLGVRFKAAVVTTDLPLEPDRPVDFGLQRFCDSCRKCARECPAKAIPMGDKVMHNGYETWRINVERCARFRVNNPHGAMCGRCMKVCPWNKPKGGVHDLVRWTVSHAGWLDPFLVKMDDVLGYGKAHPEKQWWFDHEYVDGAIKVHDESNQESAG